MPKANPVTCFGSYPAPLKTLGCTIPEPSTSSHPVFLHTRHPLPPHFTHEISTSADGSVNGKNDGRNRVLVPTPKNASTNAASVPFSSANVTSLSTRSPST